MLKAPVDSGTAFTGGIRYHADGLLFHDLLLDGWRDSGFRETRRSVTGTSVRLDLSHDDAPTAR
jgi:hypothetical protein